MLSASYAGILPMYCVQYYYVTCYVHQMAAGENGSMYMILYVYIAELQRRRPVAEDYIVARRLTRF